MSYILSIELNIITLMVVLLLPFCYVIAVSLIFKLDSFKWAILLITLVVSLLLCLAFLTKFFVGFMNNGLTQTTLFCFLHILAVSQILITIWLSRQPPIILNSFDAEKLYGNNTPEDRIDTLGWDDVIINEPLKKELISVISLLKDPKKAMKYGVNVPRGILLSGPPGNGKTTIAKIIANTTGLSFFVVTSDKLISKWVGDSEKYLSEVFQEAQQYSPSIIFIDEIDTIARTRMNGAERWSENLLNHLLQLLDGVYSMEGIYVIGATNRPDLIDPALKRSGRLNKEIDIPLPDYESRKQLFLLYLSQLPLEKAVNIALLAKKTEGCSCSDISAICNQAAMNAYRREENSGHIEHFVSVVDLALAINNNFKEQSL